MLLEVIIDGKKMIAQETNLFSINVKYKEDKQ